MRVSPLLSSSIRLIATMLGHAWCAILNCDSIHLRWLKHLLANHFAIDFPVEA